MNMDCFLKRFADILLTDKEDGTFQTINFLVGGSTSYRIGKLLNFAVSQIGGDECYVETGVYNGGTLISANYRNGRKCIGIDPYIGMVESIDPLSIRDRAKQYIAGIGEGAQLIEKDFRDVTPEEIGAPIAVSFIDAMHTEKDVFENLEWLHPLLANDALVIFDDINYQGVSNAISRWQIAHADTYDLTCYIKPFFQSINYTWSLGDRFLNNGVCILRYHKNPEANATVKLVNP